MAPEGVEYGSLQGQQPDDHLGDPDALEASLKSRLSRKRTKTGCLTCRRRRIKCGEERPICGNCVKSKRHCEGYVQRVVCNNPSIDYTHFHNGAASITFGPGAMAMPSEAASFYAQYDHGRALEYAQSQGRPLLPMNHNHPTNHYHHAHLPPVQHLQHAALPSAPNASWAYSARPPEHHYQPSSRPIDVRYDSVQLGPTAVSCPPPSRIPTTSAGIPTPAMPSPFDPQTTQFQTPVQHESSVPIPQAPTWSRNDKSQRRTPQSRSSTTTQEQWQTYAYAARPELTQPVDYRVPHSHTPQTSLSNIRFGNNLTHEPELQLSTIFDQSSADSPDRILQEAAVEHCDHDYYDVESEDDMEAEAFEAAISPERARQEMGVVMRLRPLALGSQNANLASYASLNGVVDKYRPERVASPLNNPMTARVFAHFVHVTAPAIAIFTRRPRTHRNSTFDPSLPISEQGLWTCSMPIAALHHQGLLQAMLAVSSLHIAKLTRSSTTPSIRHYAWALKRIHRNVGDPTQRNTVQVAAASLLLSFYELFSGDHVKWNSHLAGARQLLVETDFAGMNREVRRQKANQTARKSHRATRRMSATCIADQDLDQVPVIDAQVVSAFTQERVNYDDPGHVVNARNMKPSGPVNIAHFEVLKDIFWWFCRQDFVQSYISGNPLLLSSSRWADCPPRAPMNRADMVYGSSDHLAIIMGRIADYIVRDRKRKLRVISAQGGQWRPPAGMNIPRPQPNGTSSGPPQMPTFYGMAPAPSQPAQMPASYRPTYSNNSPSSSSDEGMWDLEQQTSNALEEWARIVAALDTFQSMLGPDFQPLPEDRLWITPYGPPLIYLSYDIACLWNLVNMAYIVINRAHPHMPPHAHAATGVAAAQTARYAIAVGRISAGIPPPPPDGPLESELGAALYESTLALFFAGVQYQDAAQREWIVTRLFDIERHCGNATAGVIAHGCQRAWHAAFMAGRGPPYERRYNTDSDDNRRNGSWTRVDPRTIPDEEDITDKRYVRTKPMTRLHWAAGILGTEEDE